MRLVPVDSKNTDRQRPDDWNNAGRFRCWTHPVRRDRYRTQAIDLSERDRYAGDTRRTAGQVVRRRRPGFRRLRPLHGWAK